jgi:hypothetical protein
MFPPVSCKAAKISTTVIFHLYADLFRHAATLFEIGTLRIFCWMMA